MADQRYFRKVCYLIAATTILRAVLACMVHLGNDESYYFTYALQPDWNHFDHPPLVGLFIRIFTLNLHWITDLSMRLTAIIAAGACTWIIYRCGTLLKNERAGWIAAILYNTSLYTSLISGLFILPDSPQLVFWLLTIHTALRLSLHLGNRKQENVRLILLGLYIGLATMCKIHGLFLWFGTGMYLLLWDRKYLRNPFVYLSFGLPLLIISPIVFWNMGNHFITWQFQGGRVMIHHPSLDFKSFMTTTLGQLFYNNPFNIIIYLLVWRKPKSGALGSKPLHLLNWLIFPILVATTGISLFRTTLPHWSGPGFIGLMLLSGYLIEERRSPGNRPRYRYWFAVAGSFILVIVVATLVTVNFYPGTLGSRRHPGWGKGDLTLDMYGWKELRSEFNSIRQSDLKKGITDQSAPILVDKWFPGCHELFYVAYPLHVRVVGVGTIMALHQFAWLNRKEGYLNKGSDAYYIASSNDYSDPRTAFPDDFRQISLIAKIPQRRSGRIARYWYIYRLEGARRDLGHILP